MLATGAEPVIPPIPGLRELDGIWTNREATAMQAVPRRLLAIGGGPVGVELAQAVRRLGGEVVLVEHAPRLLAREPAPLGEALGEVLRRDGVELELGVAVTAARREGEDYVFGLDDGRASRRQGARGERAPSARRRHRAGDDRDRTEPARRARRRAHARYKWGLGGGRRRRHLPADPRRQVRAEIVAANMLGDAREANFEAMPRITYTDQQAAAVGTTEGAFSGTARLNEIAKTETYTREYAASLGYLTLLSDGERLVGAHALGPEAGEWLQQATLAIRARVPLDVLSDVIQPFPTFSEIFVGALKALNQKVAAARTTVAA